MKRYWPVAGSLVLLLTAIVFLLSQGGDSDRPDEAVVAATPTPEATATPGAARPLPGPPALQPYPLVTPIGTPGPDIAVESGRGMWLGKNLQLQAVLSVLAGDTSFCANLCPLPLSPQETLALVLNECARYDPNGFRVMWANYPDILLQLNTNVSACGDLKAARDRLGAFADTQAWRDALRQINRSLETVVAGRPLPQMPGSPATPAPPIRSVAGFYPKGTLTGVETADRVLSAVYAGDLVRLADAAVFTPRACTTANQGPGTISCPQGIADGTLVPLMIFGGCSLNFVFDRDQLRERLRGVQASPLYLYGVYSASNFQGGGVLGVAVVSPANPEYPVAFYLDDAGRLVAFVGCGVPFAPDVVTVFSPRGR